MYDWNWNWHYQRLLIPENIRRIWRVLSGTHRELTPGENTLRHLQWTLQIPSDLIDAILAGSFPPRFRYRHFTIPKRDGSLREIAEPGPGLKQAQQRLAQIYLRRIYPHEAAMAYRRHRSTADHARAHAGAGVIITADIQDFFPSTTRERISEFWASQALHPDEATFFTRITTYRGALPQGAPTSPALSNLVNRDMDAALTRYTLGCGGIYTRYADDLAFSWRTGTPPPEFEAFVRRTLREYGYTLHPQKGWHVWQRSDEPEVTGLVLTKHGTVEVPRSMKRIIAALEKSKNPDDHQRLMGYRGYVHMVER